jgi:small-conductance mechanosensitive channel
MIAAMIQTLFRHDLTPAQGDGLMAVVVVVLALAAGIIAHCVVFDILARLARKREQLFGAIVRRASRPAAYILPLLAVLAVVPTLRLQPDWADWVEHVTVLATIAASAWGIAAVVLLGADYAKGLRGEPGEDDIPFRQIETRVDILSRVAVTIIVIVAAATALMTFPNVRAIGATLLASAGLAGIAVGFATRPLLENLVAGIQIALTQPIRIDDVVVIEKEFGRIEEIKATYVVVALWDRRRMILPLTYFIDKPFETWTRNTADMVGVVMLYTDYTMPVDAIRTELDRVLDETTLWDGDVKVVQVTDTSVHGIEIRILVSARNAPTTFDLRCLVREKLIAFIQERYPSALPSLRIEAPALEMAAKDGARSANAVN